MFTADVHRAFATRLTRLGIAVSLMLVGVVASSCASESTPASTSSPGGSGYSSLPGKPIDVSPHLEKVLSNYVPRQPADLRVLEVLPVPRGVAVIFTAPGIQPDQVDFSVAVFSRMSGTWLANEVGGAPIGPDWASPTAWPTLALAAADNGSFAIGGVVNPSTTKVTVDIASGSDIEVDAHEGVFLAVSSGPRPVQLRFLSGSTLIGASSTPWSRNDPVPSLAASPEMSSSDVESVVNEIRAGDGAKYFPEEIGGADAASALSDLLESYPNTESVEGAETIHLVTLSDGENEASLVLQVANTSSGPLVFGYAFRPPTG